MRVPKAQQKSGLKSAHKKVAGLASGPSGVGIKESSVGALILEKVPSKDVEGDIQASIRANG